MGNFSLQNQVILIPRPCYAKTTYQTALLFKSFIFKSLSHHFNMDTHLTSKAVEQETALLGQLIDTLSFNTCASMTCSV